MRRILLVLASSAAISGWGQSGAQAPPSGLQNNARAEWSVQEQRGVDLGEMSSQAGCPVQVLHASFDRPAQFMLTSRNASGGVPELRFQYRNASGKEIASVTLTGWLRVKESPYQLDATSVPFRIELARAALQGKEAHEEQAFDVLSNAIGFDRIELTRVTYADAEEWSAKQHPCVYANSGGTQEARLW